MRSTAWPVTGRSPRGRAQVGTSRVPLALLTVVLASGEPVRVLEGVRPEPPSLEPASARVPAAPDDPLDEPVPRETAPPLLPPPLGPDERDAAFWPSSLYAVALSRKPPRCCGANSRTARSPKLMDGDVAAPAEGELKPLLLVPPPLLVTTLPPPLETAPPPPPPPPRSTAPPELELALLPAARSAAPPSAGFCANAGPAASVRLAITIPSLDGKDFICAPGPNSATDLPLVGPPK